MEAGEARWRSIFSDTIIAFIDAELPYLLGVAVGVGEAGEEAERRLAKVEHELADSKAEVGRLREIIVQNGWNERY